MAPLGNWDAFLNSRAASRITPLIGHAVRTEPSLPPASQAPLSKSDDRRCSQRPSYLRMALPEFVATYETAYAAVGAPTQRGPSSPSIVLIPKALIHLVYSTSYGYAIA